MKLSVLFSVPNDPSGYICLTISLCPAYSIHRRRICVDIALVLDLSHALRRAFGKGSSPGRRFGRFCESGSTRYVGYASFFLTTTLHQTYNNLRIRIYCHIAHRRWLRLCWVGILLQEDASNETSAEVLPLGMSPALSKHVSSFHSSNRSAKRQAPAGITLLRGIDVYGRLILLPVAAEEFFKTHGGLLQ